MAIALGHSLSSDDFGILVDLMCFPMESLSTLVATYICVSLLLTSLFCFVSGTACFVRNLFGFLSIVVSNIIDFDEFGLRFS